MRKRSHHSAVAAAILAAHGLSGIAQAAPPLGFPAPTAARGAVQTAPGDPRSVTNAAAQADPQPTGNSPEGQEPGPTSPTQQPAQTIVCEPGSIPVGPKTCASQEIKDQIDQGLITIDENGGITIVTPPGWDPVTGQFGSFDPATQPCDPKVEVKLKQAALAGSQVTRAISDKQLGYSQTDPIEAVNNPKKDGAGGVCTIDLFAFDLGRLLGDTYAQIKNLIDILSNLSVDSLFGAACKVIHSIFGNLQNQLLQELQNHSPLTLFQQFVNQLRVGYVAPLVSWTSYGATVRPTTATVPDVSSLSPLHVSYVPGKGYVYLADVGSGNWLVVKISQTPLAPADAVTTTPAR